MEVIIKMISKIQAFEILNYVMPNITEQESESMIREATDKKKIGNTLNETKLWDLILLNEENKKFLAMRRIANIEELSLAQFEWKLKYQWRVYKNVSFSSEYNLDDADCSEFID